MLKICFRLLLSCFLWLPAQATIFTVINGNDAGAGSLRDVIAQAQNGDEIRFGGPITVVLSSAALLVDKSISIIGQQGVGITKSGGAAPTFRIMRISNAASVLIQNIRFFGATANVSGAALLAESSNLMVVDCQFEQNTSTVDGGALALGSFTLNQQVSFDKCRFTSNVAGGGGGAVITSSGSPLFTRCLFQGNRANDGGAVYNASTSAARFVNSLFSGNRAIATVGGAILNGTQSGTTIHSCTFGGNAAQQPGGALYQGGSAAALVTNSIFWGNSTEIAVGTGAAVNASYCIVQGGFAGTGNLNANPNFASPTPFGAAPTTSGSYALQNCSPAINAGTATNAPNNDINGTVRPQRDGYDMGAYETTSGIPARLYVRATAAGGNTGTSWANAYTSLQSALAQAAGCSSVKEIWVAGGAYKPTTGTDRAISFVLPSGVQVYGGFAGTETQLAQRNMAANPTILSGDIGTLNNNTDNTATLLKATNCNAETKLSGFTLTGANATLDGATSGGALLASNSSLTIEYCTIRQNNASFEAGGMLILGGSPLIQYCHFQQNSSVFAGAIYFSSASTGTVVNCLFAANSAAGSGAAILCNSGSNISVINCTMARNTGSAFANYGTSVPSIKNTIIWDNGSSIYVDNASYQPVVTNSLVQGGYPGAGNLSSNPFFTDADLLDFRLLGCSPAINSGTAVGAPANDINLSPRPALGGIDMGAYERQTANTSNVYVDPLASGNNSGSSWTNAYKSLGAALNDLNNCATGDSLFIAKGTFTAQPNVPFLFGKTASVIWGGYPNGGGTRNVVANPVLIKGEVRITKAIRMEGLQCGPQ